MGRNWTVTKDLFLSASEVQKLYSVLRDAKDLAIQRGNFDCHIRDYYILRVLLETGVRVSELTALKVSDIIQSSLIVRYGKGGKKRTVHLTKDTQRLLAEFLRIKAKILKESVESESYLFVSERRTKYTTRGIRKRVKLCFSKVGISSKLSVHSCRHSYVSHLIAAGVDLVTVRDNVGHSSLAITSLYSHAVKDGLGDLALYGSGSTRTRNC